MRVNQSLLRSIVTLSGVTFTTVALGITINLTTTPAAPSPPNINERTTVTVGQKINASGTYKHASGESNVTSIPVYWLANSDNPPNWPGPNPGIVVAQSNAILWGYTWSPDGSGSGNYTLQRGTKDVRLTAAKYQGQDRSYDVTAEPFGATAPYFDENGNPIFVSAGVFEF